MANLYYRYSKIDEENEYDNSQSEESYQESDYNPGEESQDSDEDDLRLINQNA